MIKKLHELLFCLRALISILSCLITRCRTELNAVNSLLTGQHHVISCLKSNYILDVCRSVCNTWVLQDLFLIDKGLPTQLKEKYLNEIFESGNDIFETFCAYTFVISLVAGKSFSYVAAPLTKLTSGLLYFLGILFIWE